MKIAVISLVLLGVLAAVCAAVLMATLTSTSTASPTAANVEQEVEILLAARDIPAMSVVDTTAVTTKRVPKSQVPAEALLNPVQVVGKVLTDRLVANQPFTKACFAREGTGVYLAAAVPPGKRAMSITLTDWSGMAGLLYPGSVVDVLVSFKTLTGAANRDNAEMMSTTLLQGLQVLAIGSQSIADDNYKDKEAGALAARGQINFRMVTLLVTPKEAEVLQLAMQNGSISLAMRNPLDADTEARRLTRAREIAPNAGAMAVTSSEPTDAFAPRLPVASRAAAEALQNYDPTLPQGWQTIIIRGDVSETRTFPVEPEEAPKQQQEQPPATDDAGVPVAAGARSQR